MITRRYRKPKGINTGAPFYGFYVMVSGESREMLRDAHKKLSAELGDVPSNGLLLDEVLKKYLGR